MVHILKLICGLINLSQTNWRSKPGAGLYLSPEILVGFWDFSRNPSGQYVCGGLSRGPLLIFRPEAP